MTGTHLLIKVLSLSCRSQGSLTPPYISKGITNPGLCERGSQESSLSTDSEVLSQSASTASGEQLSVLEKGAETEVGGQSSETSWVTGFAIKEHNKEDNYYRAGCRDRLFSPSSLKHKERAVC